jgi:hypothetical protein
MADPGSVLVVASAAGRKVSQPQDQLEDESGGPRPQRHVNSTGAKPDGSCAARRDLREMPVNRAAANCHPICCGAD